MQHVEIIWSFCVLGGDLLSFSVPGGTEKMDGLWFAKGDQQPSIHYITDRIILPFYQNNKRTQNFFFLKLLFGCPTAIFGPFSRGRPHLPDVYHCVLTISTRRSPGAS